MVPMISPHPRTLNVGGRRYAAEADVAIEVDPDHVDRLAVYGFARADTDRGEDEESSTLEDATLAELRRLAGDREIEGRSKMDREELLEALRTDTGQEA